MMKTCVQYIIVICSFQISWKAEAVRQVDHYYATAMTDKVCAAVLLHPGLRGEGLTPAEIVCYSVSGTVCRLSFFTHEFE